jgi:uncharacterized protein YegJ (DUF2314 family)
MHLTTRPLAFFTRRTATALLGLSLIAASSGLHAQGAAAKPAAPKEDTKAEVVEFNPQDPTMQRAFKEAQRTLGQFLMATSGDNPNLDNVGVRARITVGPHTEYLWVMPVGTADGQKFQGQLNDVPQRIQTLTLAQEVTFKRADIVDWMYQDTKTKIMHGHYTTCALMKKAPAKELSEMKSRYGLDCAARLKRLR